MVTAPRLAGAGTVRWPEPDIYDYGAERILVVDDPTVVDLLVENDVHTSARAVVIDRSGYPTAITELARALVRDRPDVPVAMLHASDADRAALTASIQALLGASAPVTDLGIDPGVISGFKALRWARRLDRLPLDALPHWLLTGPLVEAMITNSPIAASLLTTRDGATSYVDLAYYIVVSDGDYG
jgi:hypothetical protein